VDYIFFGAKIMVLADHAQIPTQLKFRGLKQNGGLFQILKLLSSVVSSTIF